MQRAEEKATAAELASMNAAARERVEKVIAGVRELEKRIGPGMVEFIGVPPTAPGDAQGAARERVDKLIASVRELENHIGSKVAAVADADVDPEAPDAPPAASPEAAPAASPNANGDAHVAASSVEEKSSQT